MTEPTVTIDGTEVSSFFVTAGLDKTRIFDPDDMTTLSELEGQQWREFIVIVNDGQMYQFTNVGREFELSVSKEGFDSAVARNLIKT